MFWLIDLSALLQAQHFLRQLHEVATVINDYCHAIGSVSVISTTEMPSTTELTTPRSCDCGKYSRSCSFDRFGRKNCDCYFGAIQINDYCHAIGSVSVISTTKMPSTTEITTPRRSVSVISTTEMSSTTEVTTLKCKMFAYLGETTTAASTTEMTSTTKFLTTPVVNAVKYSRSCRFDYFGRQVCECYPGYVQINNYCHESTTAVSTTEERSTPEISTTPKTTPTPSVVTTEERPRTTIPSTALRRYEHCNSLVYCYCGINSRSCRLNWFGLKICDCYLGYEQIDGYCLARTTTVRPITTTRELCNDENVCMESVKFWDMDMNADVTKAIQVLDVKPRFNQN
ncbi:hypothetical protein CEXT_662061 [Caerostris extrusa]|uniref:EB domain-containing protein n=1 Tax=Caerostris extrusa TaxID=172846 RepID=A0AAV4PXC8_CAEEX|nr:hypothetical protein CEXT_662061 [Caerostris extrusa]